MAGLRTAVRHILRLILFIVPIPFGAFASDKMFFASLSVLVFVLASLALPCTVRWRQMQRYGISDYAPVGAILYGGVIVLAVSFGVLNGCLLSPLWQSYGWRVGMYAAWLIGTVAVQAAAAWGIGAWQKRLRRYWFSEFLDPILFALPLPCALMGMFLFPGVAGEDMTQSLIIGMLGIIGFGFLAIGVLVIGTFAFYFFPKKGLYGGAERIVQLVRIVAMTAVWLGIHYVFLNTSGVYFKLFVLYFLPVSQNSPAVFVSPFILESLCIVVSVAVANVLAAVLQHAMPGARK